VPSDAKSQSSRRPTQLIVSKHHRGVQPAPASSWVPTARTLIPQARSARSQIVQRVLLCTEDSSRKRGIEGERPRDAGARPRSFILFKRPWCDEPYAERSALCGHLRDLRPPAPMFLGCRDDAGDSSSREPAIARQQRTRIDVTRDSCSFE